MDSNRVRSSKKFHFRENVHDLVVNCVFIDIDAKNGYSITHQSSS